MVKLGEVCSFRRGLTYSKSSEVEQSSTVVLRSNNVNLERNTLDLRELRCISDEIKVPPEKRVVAGAILMCMANGSKAHLGKVALIDRDYGYAFGGFMGLLIPAKNIDSRFLYHTLSSPRFKNLIQSLSDGANINNLKFDDIAQFPISLPPLEEQRAIVERVEKRMGRVERMEAGFQRMGKWAGKRRQAVLAEAFGESGGGEDGEAEGNEEEEFCPKRPRRSAALPAMCNPGASQASGEGRALSRPPSHGACNSVKGEECGRAARAPTGWPQVKLGDVCEMISTRGHQIKQEDICSEGTYPVVSQSANLIEGYSDFPNPVLSVPLVLFGDHTCCVKLVTFPFVVGADGTKLLVPTEDCSIKYLYNACLYFSEKVKDGRYRRHFSDFQSLEILLPPLSDQRAIVERLEKRLQQAERVSNLSRAGAAWCAKLRRAVLEEAFS